MGWLGPGQNLAVAGEEIQLLKSDLPESAGLDRDQWYARLSFGLSTFNFGLVLCPNSLAW